MLTKSKNRFSLATLLWLMFSITMFFGGRWSRQSEVRPEIAALKERIASQLDLQAATEQKAKLSNARADFMQECLEAAGGGFVVRVHDGDTMVIVSAGPPQYTDVEIAGIDCPAVRQAYGDEANTFTSYFCLRKIVNPICNEVDLYGDRVADVLVNGQSLREALLVAGLARHSQQQRPEIGKP